MLIERIEAERKREGMSLEELAHMVGVTKQSYLNWKNGAKVPAVKLAEIAKVLNCSTDYLLGLTEQRKIAG